MCKGRKNIMVESWLNSILNSHSHSFSNSSSLLTTWELKSVASEDNIAINNDYA